MRKGGWYDAKAVVHIPFQKNLLGVVGVPKVVRSLPLEFSGDDWDAAQCGGDLVANGGSLDLFEAHVHDSDNACGERCLDDEFEVSEVDGLAVE